MRELKQITPMVIDGRCVKCNALVSGYEEDEDSVMFAFKLLPCGCVIVPVHAYRHLPIDED